MTSENKQRISAINNGIVPEGYKKTKIGIVPAEWEECHFKKMFSRLKRKNTENNTNVLTISAQYGLINQEKFFNKSVASDDKSNYYLLYKGDFAYNKSYSNGYPFGAIKSLIKYEKGVVSPLYICFSPTEKNKCPDYFLQYFESGLINREIQAIAQEGARNHGLLNIGIDDFFNSYIVLPPLPEQQKIAEILSTQDKLIELQEKKIEQLKELKKGYLQKMFPAKGSKYPELRFKGFTDAWEQRKLGELCSIVTKQTGFDYTATIKKSLVTESSDDTLPYLQTKNFTGISIDYNTDYYIPKTIAKEFPKINLDEKCLLFSIVGASVGNIGLFPGDKHCFLSGAICVSKLQKQEDADFLYHYMCSEKGQSQIRNCTKGGAQATITIEDIRDFYIQLPSEEERYIIGEYLSSFDTLITLHQRKLEQEKQKKKALMQLLLTGKVRVKI